MGKTFNMVGGGGGLSPDLPIGSRINVTSDLGTTITASKGNLSYTKQINWDARLPSAYQEVSYIQSTGTQKINTEVCGWDNLVITNKMQILSSSGSEFYFFGSSDIGQNGYNYAGYFTNLNGFVFQLGNYITYGTRDTLVHTHVYDRVNNRVEIDGTYTQATGITWYTDSVSEGHPFYLFQRDGYSSNSGSMRLFESIFEKNGVEIRHYIPCYRKADFVAGLYDLVNDTFYTNCATTGSDFIVGYPVRCLPLGYTQYEYLESSGTEYIDTGFIPTTTTSLDVSFKGIRTESGGRVFFGTTDANNTSGYRFYAGFSSSKFFAWYASYQINDSTSSSNTDVLNLHFGSDNVSLNGRTIATTSSYTLLNPGKSIYLFQGNGSGSSFMPTKMYWCRIIDNSTMIRCFIPCTNSNNIAGMYDIVNGVFYDNDGTGTFTLGDRVTPEEGTATFVTHFSGNWTVYADKTGEQRISDVVSVSGVDDTDYYVELFWIVNILTQGV